MHAFSILTLGIFVAGYSTARWDLTTRLYELAIFAWDHGVITRAAKGFGLLTVVFVVLVLPFAHLAAQETELVSGTTRRNLGREADRRSILELQAPASLRASSSSGADRSSGVAGWGYGHTHGVGARILAIRCALKYLPWNPSGLPKLRDRPLRRRHTLRSRGVWTASGISYRLGLIETSTDM